MVKTTAIGATAVQSDTKADIANEVNPSTTRVWLHIDRDTSMAAIEEAIDADRRASGERAPRRHPSGRSTTSHGAD